MLDTTVLLAGAIGGALARAATTRDYSWRCGAALVDTVVAAVPSIWARDAIGALPFAWAQALAAKIDSPIEQALLAGFVAYALSHVVAVRLRTQLPEWIARKLDERAK